MITFRDSAPRQYNMSCSHVAMYMPNHFERDSLLVPSLCHTSFHATSLTVQPRRAGPAYLRPPQAPSRPSPRGRFAMKAESGATQPAAELVYRDGQKYHRTDHQILPVVAPAHDLKRVLNQRQ